MADFGLSLVLDMALYIVSFNLKISMLVVVTTYENTTLEGSDCKARLNNSVCAASTFVLTLQIEIGSQTALDVNKYYRENTPLVAFCILSNL